jgi:hypothetical protein
MSNLFYLLSAAHSSRFARHFLTGLLTFTEFVSGGTVSVRHALGLRMADFENALQVAAAISGDANFILTQNIPDYRGLTVTALAPTDFHKRFVT